jgi:hypothetical protein
MVQDKIIFNSPHEKNKCDIMLIVFWAAVPCSLVEVYHHYPRNLLDDGGSKYL